MNTPKAVGAEERSSAVGCANRTFDRTRWNLPQDDACGFVRIPAGDFAMGEPGHATYVAEFYIARFHTTVAQFRAFVDASGFEPGNPDCLKGPEDHPVVWVSWYEAIAYCNWLNTKLAGIAEHEARPDAGFWDEIVNGRLHVSLPSEAEWEKAARGNTGNLFPWGNEIDTTLANYKESEINTTTAVGSYPKGASPYGIFDRSGNAWNWLRTVWGASEDNPTFVLPYIADDGREDLSAAAEMLRGMRGGAFTVESARAQSTFRDGVPPKSRDDADGFRVVITAKTMDGER